MTNFLDMNPDVMRALQHGEPVVALESTIISHGMPYPQNVEMAKRVEQIVRDNGATPATIAIMDGKIKIGLSDEDLQKLATAHDVAKVSRRDMAHVLATKGIGATTVASTMICAEMAGIKFFVTGGIGGVHRGFEQTMDVSADLEELAMTNVTVICAGAKAILDLPRTMEYLETKGVPVIGYQTNVLPAFYTAQSDIQLQQYSDDIATIASIIKTKDAIALGGGVLIVNPVPEQESMSSDYINGIIERALQQADQERISGKDITPYLLAKIVELTDGKSLETNIALVYNNAKIGAQLAVSYSQL